MVELSLDPAPVVPTRFVGINTAFVVQVALFSHISWALPEWRARMRLLEIIKMREQTPISPVSIAAE
jgi:hypothetical protein